MNLVHLAHRVTEIGEVSPLCAESPYPLGDNEGYTNVRSQATCPLCLDIHSRRRWRRIVVALAVLCLTAAYWLK